MVKVCLWPELIFLLGVYLIFLNKKACRYGAKFESFSIKNRTFVAYFQ